MATSNTNLVNKQKSEEILRRREYLLRACLATLAVGLGVEITPERVILYLKPLADLTDSQIKRGFELALKEYKPYGGSYPSPGELREYALREEPARYADVKEILSRDAKPADWRPMTAEEAKEMLATIRAGKLA